MYKKIDYKSKYALSKIQNIEDKSERIKNYKIAIKELQTVDVEKYNEAKKIASLRFFNVKLKKKYLSDINTTEAGLKHQFRELQKLANMEISERLVEKRRENARDVLKKMNIDEQELANITNKELDTIFRKISKIQKDKRYNIINAKRDEETGKIILSNDTDLTSLAERSVLTSDEVIKMIYDFVTEELSKKKTLKEINKELDETIEKLAQEMVKVKENQLGAVLKMSFK